MTQTELLGFIILSPLVGFLLLGVLYLISFKIKIPKIIFTFIGIIAPIISFIITSTLFLDALANKEIVFHQTLFIWFSIDVYTVSVALLGDHLSLFMAMFISFIGSLIHIYATGYMKNDIGYGKFFAYFHLFMASMLLLVLGDGPLMMFIGWEGVGLCSYLLISYYYGVDKNVNAGNKAFIVNRVGDFGFLIGLSLLFVAIGEYGFDYASLEANISKIPTPMLSAIGLLLFIGAMGKSAQIPLFIWLPDAMAGPTPVSALIHAATMVTAGLYMVARFGFMYDLIPDVGLFIAYIGAGSALFAAIIATQQRDIKKILAYSTMSQLGYMFVAMGLGAYDAGLFHVFTHAFFKALLFLGAGSIIIALHHEQDIFKMGGLSKTMPLTFITMGVASLAICGIPPFSGFFSKDAILAGVFANGEYLIWITLFATAGLTAYYMTRLMMLTFVTPSKKEHNIISPTKPMQWILIILAIGSIFAGIAGFPEILGGNNFLKGWLGNVYQLDISHSVEYILMIANILIVLCGAVFAYKRFATKAIEPNLDNKVINTISNKFYIDELYSKMIISPLKNISLFFAHTVDNLIIEKFIYFTLNSYRAIGKKVALMQNGNVRFYALYMLIGISITFIYIGWLV